MVFWFFLWYNGNFGGYTKKCGARVSVSKDITVLVSGIVMALLSFLKIISL
jgi:hypothetical protein